MLAWLDQLETQRRAAGLRRSLRPRPAVATELDLASNDYPGGPLTPGGGNLGAVVGLSGRGSLPVFDADSHASLVDACRLSRARVVVTPHRDVDA